MCVEKEERFVCVREWRKMHITSSELQCDVVWCAAAC